MFTDPYRLLASLGLVALLTGPLAAHAFDWSDMAFGFERREELRKSWKEHEERAIRERDEVRLQSNLIQAKRLEAAIRRADDRAKAIIQNIGGQ